MFDQVHLAEISGTVGMIAFFVSAGVFAFVVTPKQKIDRLANLPLDENSKP
jgi:cbb3-type cytochrome oxidase subunit 3